MRPSFIAGSFFALTQLAPRWRPALWRFWYDALARRDAAGLLLFMNYGYDDGAAMPGLLPADEPFRYAIQLYAHAVRGIDLSDKDVLEVGCGRGGGGSYFLRYCDPRSYTGVDLSSAAIAWCQNQLKFPRTNWVQGCADNLPAPDSSVDVVVNVESSHSYPSVPGFLQEVCRVLRPGGHFAFADLRKEEQMPELDEQIDRCGLLRIEHALITKNVVRALDAITQRREAQIEAGVPRALRAAFRDFAGVRNSVLYRMLAADRLRYFSCLLQKPG